MKKFLALMCSVLVLCLSFAGCSGGWTEVQSITYSVGGETTTYTSKICYYGTSEEIDQATYESAPEGQKESYSNFLMELYGDMYYTDVYNIQEWTYPQRVTLSVHRNSVISFSDSMVNKTYFCESLGDYYTKETISSYEIQYVKFKPSDGDNIEISYYQNGEARTIRVLPTSYEITYFED